MFLSLFCSFQITCCCKFLDFDFNAEVSEVTEIYNFDYDAEATEVADADAEVFHF